MERYCKECGKEIHGRSDKIFCSDGCRNYSNNIKTREFRQHIQLTNRALLKNFRILNEVLSKGKRVIQREELISLGFDFKYFTAAKAGRNGKLVMQCYNYSYINSSKNVIYISLKNN